MSNMTFKNDNASKYKSLFKNTMFVKPCCQSKKPPYCSMISCQQEIILLGMLAYSIFNQELFLKNYS